MSSRARGAALKNPRRKVDGRAANSHHKSDADVMVELGQLPEEPVIVQLSEVARGFYKKLAPLLSRYNLAMDLDEIPVSSLATLLELRASLQAGIDEHGALATTAAGNPKGNALVPQLLTVDSAIHRWCTELGIGPRARLALVDITRGGGAVDGHIAALQESLRLSGEAAKKGHDKAVEERQAPLPFPSVNKKEAAA